MQCLGLTTLHSAADREVQRILLELLNQMDGFDQNVNVKVRGSGWQGEVWCGSQGKMEAGMRGNTYRDRKEDVVGTEV